MTPSSALEVTKGLNVSMGHACAGFKDHLSCPHITKDPERRREVGPVSEGPDLCSLQPGSIPLKRCRVSGPPAWPRAALACPEPSVQAVPLLCTSAAAGGHRPLTWVVGGQAYAGGKGTALSERGQTVGHRPDHRHLSTLVPSQVGSAAVCSLMPALASAFLLFLATFLNGISEIHIHMQKYIFVNFFFLKVMRTLNRAAL